MQCMLTWRKGGNDGFNVPWKMFSIRISRGHLRPVLLHSLRSILAGRDCDGSSTRLAAQLSSKRVGEPLFQSILSRR
jgi:hypothetical protein